MSVNKVMILGYLGKDPELKSFDNGGSVVNFSVATSEKWKDKNTGEMREETEWHRVQFSGKRAEVIAKYFKKGSKIYVEGKLKTRTYTDKNGIERQITEVRGWDFDFCGGAQGGNENAQHSSQETSHETLEDDDIPF